MITITLSPKEKELVLASLRHSYNEVEARSKLSKYYPVEKDSRNEEALKSLLTTKAKYASMILLLVQS